MIPPGCDRQARLDEVRADPTEWGSVDLGMLLEAWGFENRDLGVSNGMGQTHWFWPRERAYLEVVILSTDPISRGTTERVVWLIDEAIRRGYTV